MKTQVSTLWPHPGAILKECLEDLCIPASKLSSATKIPQSRITEIMKGRRGITPATALLLAKALGTTPEYWLNLQQGYDLRTVDRSRVDEVEVLVS